MKNDTWAAIITAIAVAACVNIGFLIGVEAERYRASGRSPEPAKAVAKASDSGGCRCCSPSWGSPR